MYPLLAAAAVHPITETSPSLCESNLREPNPACWFIFLWWDDKLERMKIAELKHFDTKKDIEEDVYEPQSCCCRHGWMLDDVVFSITLEVDGREVHKPQMEVC